MHWLGLSSRVTVLGTRFSVRRDGDAVGGLETLRAARHDVGLHALLAGNAAGDELVVAAGRREQVEHAEKCRGGDLRHGQEGDDDATVFVRHGRDDRNDAKATLASATKQG